MKLTQEEAFERIGTKMVHYMNSKTVFFNHAVEDMLQFTSNNVNAFREIFGPEWFTYQGEYLEHVWEIKIDETRLILYSGHRGTSLEVEYPEGIVKFRNDTEVGELLNRFINNTIEKIQNYEKDHPPR